MAERTIHIIVTIINKFIEDMDIFSSRLSARKYFRQQIRQNFNNIKPEDLEHAEEKGIVEGEFCTVNWIHKNLSNKV